MSSWQNWVPVNIFYINKPGQAVVHTRNIKYGHSPYIVSLHHLRSQPRRPERKRGLCYSQSSLWCTYVKPVYKQCVYIRIFIYTQLQRWVKQTFCRQMAPKLAIESVLSLRPPWQISVSSRAEGYFRRWRVARLGPVRRSASVPSRYIKHELGASFWCQVQAKKASRRAPCCLSNKRSSLGQRS